MKLNCNDCPKTFKSKLALKYHKKKHDKPHVCRVCKCRFTSKDEAEIHTEKHNVHHENNRPLEHENVSGKSEMHHSEIVEFPHFTGQDDKIDRFTLCNYQEKENSHSEEQTACNVKCSKQRVKSKSKCNCNYKVLPCQRK